MGSIVDKLMITGKTAIVTGGHSGIGKGICEALSQAGANIVIAGRREELGQRVANEISNANNVKAIYVKTDITNAQDIQNAVFYDRRAFFGRACRRARIYTFQLRNASVRRNRRLCGAFYRVCAACAVFQTAALRFRGVCIWNFVRCGGLSACFSRVFPGAGVSYTSSVGACMVFVLPRRRVRAETRAGLRQRFVVPFVCHKLDDCVDTNGHH